MALKDLTPQLRTRLSRVERAVGWFVLLALVLLVAGFGYYAYTTAQRKGWFQRKIAEADGQSLVEFQPLSGRTHQIRVHAARGLGAAIAGDPVYSLPDDAELGGMTLPDSGMLLHSWRLVVPRDPKPPIDVTAPVPDRFGRWLDYL